MNTFQSCRNTSDAVPLYLPQNLYLKPIARINISVQLPQQIEPGKSISNWEIMEKLRVIIRPEEFPILKVSTSTLEFVRFEAEIEDKSKLNRIMNLIDGQSLQLNSFRHPAKVRAAEAKLEFPNRHAWDSFFRDAKNMDEMKPGERPDTIHFSNLPIKWFVPTHLPDVTFISDFIGLKPSERIFQRIFEKFGEIRNVDIPICDPYRSKMKEHMTGMRTFTFDQDNLFEGYVQFKDYIGFTRAMDAFRGMKLLHKDINGAQTINIVVDFDKTKHLSDASLRRRQIVRDRLIAKDREKEEKAREDQEKKDQEEQAKRQRELKEKEDKERRQREREERRKARHFAQLKLKETEELQKRIVKEERKLLRAKRKLEAIRLIGELFSRIKIKKEKVEASKSDIDKNSTDEFTKLKTLREQKVVEQREKLHKALEGRVVLNSILGDDDKHDSSTDSSSDSASNKTSKGKHKKMKRKKKKKKSKSHKVKKEKRDKEEPTPSTSAVHPFPAGSPGWYGFPPNQAMYPFPPMFAPPIRGVQSPYFPYPGGRGRGLNGLPGPSRPMYPRRRGSFNPHWSRGWRGRRGALLPHYTPELEQEYYKYFRKFLDEDENEAVSSSSRSRSRSHSRSRSRRRSYSSKSKSRRRSYSRSSRSRSRSRSRNRSRSRTRRSSSRSYTRSRRSSRSRSRGKSRSRRRTRSRTQSRSRSNRRSHDKSSRRASRSPSYKSIDSSKFISPNRLRAKHSRSKSWSLPRNTGKRSSWSKSPKSS